MNLLRLRSALALGLVLLLTACATDRVKLEGTNFTDQIDLTQNLRFTFTGDLVSEAQLDRWDTTQYVQFEPAVRGRFKWTAKNEVIFSPLEGFQASTDYKATLTDELARHDSTGKKSVATEELAFHTPYLDVVSSQAYWTRNEQGGLQARVQLRFNYRVSPTQLRELLTATYKDQALTPQILTSDEAAREVEVALDGIKVEAEENLSITLEVKPGLKCAESEWVSKEIIRHVVSFPMSNMLGITNVETEYTGSEGIITVYATQALVATQVRQYVKLSPNVNHTVEITSGGFRIRGAFDMEQKYTLTIGKGLPGVLGNTLEQDYEQTIAFTEPGEAIAFANERGMYLSSKGARNIGVRINNINTVKVKVVKIYENNIQAFLRSGTQYDGYYDSDKDTYHSVQYYETEYYGDVIMEREYDVRTLPRSKGAHLLTLDFTDPKADFKGIYVVEVGSKDKYYLRTSKIIALSDIGLIARRSGNDVMVFANSLMTAEPLSGLKVTLVSSNNQNMYEAKTDGDGVAVFSDIAARAPGFKSAMISARTEGGDFNYLLMGASYVEMSRFEVGGKNMTGRDYDAFLYCEREIYRPGDSVYLNAIVRTPDWKAVKDMPVRVKVVLPNGREMTSLRGVLNAQGAFSTKFVLPTATVTGTYEVELYTSSDKLLTAKPISVEEFMPDKIKVVTKLNRETLQASDALTLSLQANNMFGPPAAYRNWQAEVTLNRGNFTAKGFENYDFSLSGDRQLETISRSGQTDAQGAASTTFDNFDGYQNIGVVDGRVYTTVFDESGRPVNRSQRFQLFTQRVFFGIGMFDMYVSPRTALQIPLAAVDANGKATRAQARLQVIRNHWETVIENSYGRYQYRSQRRQQVMVDRLIDVNGSETKFAFTPSQDGEYEVRLSKPGAEYAVVRSFYSYGWGETSGGFEVSPDGHVLIEANKEKYEAGDKAELLFKTPFEGRLLVTVERDRVLEHHYLTTEGNAAKLTLPLTDDHLPNVYITATLIRPMGAGSATPLMVAHGYQSLKVDQPKRKLPVQIVAAEKSTSRTRQVIKVKTAPGAEVTIAAVDEGILQVKNTKTPNPYDYFYAQRALEVESFDLYAQLLPELRGGGSSYGGDGYDLSRRVNPLTDKRIKLLAFWSGQVKANGDGEAMLTIDIPQFAGAIRLMAVAYDDESFGSGEAEMKVADPVVIRTALPRFLAPTDTLLVPVTLTNTTTGGGQATASIAVKGALKVVGAASASVNLPANAENRVVFKVAAAPQMGSASVTVTVKALGGTYTEKVDLPVRPAGGLVKQYGAGTVAQGQTAALDMAGAGLIPNSREGKVVVAASPLVQFNRSLDYLLGYPHGCIEQTVSKAFPQLYYADMVEAVGRTGDDKRSVAYDVNAAIAKIQSMQLYDGGMAYWPGGQESVWWGSAFASHFLHEARRAGYDVSDAVQRKLLDYLERAVAKRELSNYYFADGSYKSLPRREIFYSLFVLALQGRHQQSVMNYYKANLEQLAPESRYLLAASYALTGDMATYGRLLPTAFNDQTVGEFGGSYGSPIRNRALALYTLLEVDPKNSQVPQLARLLSENLLKERYLNTQESVFGFLAMGRFARLNPATEVEGSVMQGSRTVGEIDGAKPVAVQLGASGQKVQVKATEGTLYYFYEVSGIDATGSTPEQDNNLKVRRTFYDRNGSVISGTTFRQNDLVVVRLSVSATGNDAVENLVVSDLLPAGFEIENPRVTEMPELKWISDAAVPTHMDIRDDRVNLYTDLPSGGRTYHFYYVVRVVSPGTFRVGPATADAMYRADFSSLSGAGTVTVLPFEAGADD